MKWNEIPFLKEVAPAVLAAVSPAEKRYSKNETVYAEGAPCSGMDIVLAGSLVAYAASPNGSESVVFSFEKGGVIGANLLFGDANRYPMNIYCTAPCLLLHLAKADVETLLHDYPFTRQFVRALSLNAQGMNRKIAMYTQKSLRQNLCNYLLALSAQQRSRRVQLPTSKKQLADYLGVQRPSLFRELKMMKDEGLICIEKSVVELKGLGGSL